MPPRKFPVRQPVVVDVGCGCRRPKLPSFLTSTIPKPKPSNNHHPSLFSPSTTTTTATTTTTTSSPPSSPSPSAPKKNTNTKKKGPVDESVAVVKESSDPYVDFKESMIQMIVEMEIYAWDDLRDLLHRFLALNAPYHHHLILRAFAEIWNGLFMAPPASGASPAAARRRRQRRR